jgi:hypothetical protein
MILHMIGGIARNMPVFVAPALSSDLEEKKDEDLRQTP